MIVNKVIHPKTVFDVTLNEDEMFLLLSGLEARRRGVDEGWILQSPEVAAIEEDLHSALHKASLQAYKEKL